MLALTAASDSTAELRGWIALGLALLVGSASVTGVVVAVVTYVRNAWDRKVAVARLVWANTTKQKSLDEDAHIPFQSLTFDHYVVWQSHATNHEGPRGTTATVNQRSVLLLVEITNNSEEPIGDLTLRVRNASGQQLEAPGLGLRVLPPRTSTVALVVLPVAHAPNVAWSLHSVTVFFRDSAGHRWKREGIDPPESWRLPRKPLKALHASFTRRAGK